MKKYILSMAVILAAISCGPTETQEQELTDLVADWKEASVQAVELSQEIGDKLFLLETKKEAGEVEETMEVNLDGEKTSCEPEYRALAKTVDSFVQDWQEKSKKVDELTNSMAVGKWSSMEQESLEDLTLELRQREVDIAQWEKDLEELNENCSMTEEMLVIQEQES
ncbi:hypothetical protein [Algoriphagus namhaensis]